MRPEEPVTVEPVPAPPPPPTPAEQAAARAADLAAAIATWVADPNRGEPWDSDPPGTVATLALRNPAGAVLAEATLNSEHVRELGRLLRHAGYDNRAARESDERVTKMAQAMVAARRAGEDVGELIGAAAQQAAGVLHSGAIRLVIGRTGSWEADLFLKWADAGGTVDNPEYVDQLADLFIEMAEAKEDGGEILSQAMGRAVNELGSMRAFAAGSGWEDQLRNIGGQHATVADGWGF